MVERKNALQPERILYSTIGWSSQQISNAIQAGNEGYASVSFPPGSPDTIEITTAIFPNFFETWARISAVKPDSSLRQENTVPKISHPIPVTEVVPTRSLNPENTVPKISHPIPVTGIIRNKGKLLRRVVNIFDFESIRQRLAGKTRPQRQI